MKAEIEGTELKIDLQGLVESLSPEAKRALARQLAFDETLIQAVTEAVAEGQFFHDEESGPWWFGGDFETELRSKLIPLMPVATRELVRGLIRQRDQARALERQTRDEYWRLWHAWPRSCMRDRPDPSLEFPHVDEISEAETETIVAGERAP